MNWKTTNLGFGPSSEEKINWAGELAGGNAAEGGFVCFGRLLYLDSA